MRASNWALIATGVFLLSGCDFGKKPGQTGSGNTTTAQSTSSQSTESFGSDLKVTLPQDGVQGPNVRAAWTVEGHAAGSTYSYVVGKGEDCSDPVYQGAELQVGQIALSLTKGTYYLCVTQKVGERTRTAANSPYKFKVNL